MKAKTAAIRVIDRILAEIFASDFHMTDQHLGEYAHALETCKMIMADCDDDLDAYLSIQDQFRDEMNGRYIIVSNAVLDWLLQTTRNTMFALRLSIVNQIATLYKAAA